MEPGTITTVVEKDGIQINATHFHVVGDLMNPVFVPEEAWNGLYEKTCVNRIVHVQDLRGTHEDGTEYFDVEWYTPVS